MSLTSLPPFDVRASFALVPKAKEDQEDQSDKDAKGSGRKRLARKLQEHLGNLDQVDEALKADPENEELLTLKTDLKYLIRLISDNLLNSKKEKKEKEEKKPRITDVLKDPDTLFWPGKGKKPPPPTDKNKGPLVVPIIVKDHNLIKTTVKMVEMKDIATVPNLPDFFYPDFDWSEASKPLRKASCCNCKKRKIDEVNENESNDHPTPSSNKRQCMEDDSKKKIIDEDTSGEDKTAAAANTTSSSNNGEEQSIQNDSGLGKEENKEIVAGKSDIPTTACTNLNLSDISIIVSTSINNGEEQSIQKDSDLGNDTNEEIGAGSAISGSSANATDPIDIFIPVNIIPNDGDNIEEQKTLSDPKTEDEGVNRDDVDNIIPPSGSNISDELQKIQDASDSEKTKTEEMNDGNDKEAIPTICNGNFEEKCIVEDSDSKMTADDTKGKEIPVIGDNDTTTVTTAATESESATNSSNSEGLAPNDSGAGAGKSEVIEEMSIVEDINVTISDTSDANKEGQSIQPDPGLIKTEGEEIAGESKKIPTTTPTSSSNCSEEPKGVEDVPDKTGSVVNEQIAVEDAIPISSNLSSSSIGNVDEKANELQIDSNVPVPVATPSPQRTRVGNNIVIAPATKLSNSQKRNRRRRRMNAPSDSSSANNRTDHEKMDGDENMITISTKVFEDSSEGQSDTDTSKDEGRSDTGIKFVAPPQPPVPGKPLTTAQKRRLQLQRAELRKMNATQGNVNPKTSIDGKQGQEASDKTKAVNEEMDTDDIEIVFITTNANSSSGNKEAGKNKSKASAPQKPILPLSKSMKLKRNRKIRQFLSENTIVMIDGEITVHGLPRPKSPPPALPLLPPSSCSKCQCQRNSEEKNVSS